MVQKGFTNSLALIVLVDGQALDFSKIGPDGLKGAASEDAAVDSTNTEVSDPLVKISKGTVQHVPALGVVVYQLSHGGYVSGGGRKYLHHLDRVKQGDRG